MSARVAGHLPRVDRVHLVAGGDQGLHPRAPLGLDPDHHLHRLGTDVTDMLADHRVQPGDPRDPFGQLGLAQHPTRGILHLDVVVVFRPVVSDEQQHASSSPSTVDNA
jgi:hypothetical protein